VKVKGYAKKTISSDLAVFEATIFSENKDLKACYELINKDKQKIEEYLKKFGFTDKETEFSHYQLPKF